MNIVYSTKSDLRCYHFFLIRLYTNYLGSQISNFIDIKKNIHASIICGADKTHLMVILVSLDIPFDVQQEQLLCKLAHMHSCT